MSGGTTFGCCKKHGDYCGKTCPFCQIDKLKEQIDGAFNMEHDDSLPALIYKNREVLRDTINETVIYSKTRNKLLEKLDVGKTEKKEVDCGFIKEGYFVNVFGEIIPIPKIASGGDTSGVDKKSVTEDNDKSSLTLPNDSKPPEPMSENRMKYTRGIWKNKKKDSESK